MSLFFQDFSSWLQGMLFILIAYHTTSYFFTRDKSFAIYAAFLLLVTIYLIPKTNNATSYYLAEKFSCFFNAFNWIIQIWYWMLYSWFCIHFLNLKEKDIRLAVQIMLYILVTTVFCTLFFIVDYYLFHQQYMTRFFLFVYTPVTLLIISFFIKAIYQFKDKVNNFFVVGLIFFVGFSVLALCLSFVKNYPFKNIDPIDFFMIGVLLEAIILSIGLAYKYHNYRKERDNYNALLIAELQKNDTLKDQLNEKLSEKVESHKLAEVEALYEKQINELKLTSLLSQMNPHFIFNALNSIKLYIINHEPKIAAYYLNKFSKLIRKILEASTNKEVTLQEELETMDLYMTIENIRFSNEINFNINVNENINLKGISVPPLVLQPFLENAIWHGLSSKKEDKKINLSIIKSSKKHILIIIEDNGIGRKASAKIKADKSINRKSIGISITKDRLSNFVKNLNNDYTIIYDDLFDENKKPIGTKVVLSIPLA
ncbi:sensor histidine kinase [Polaribacter sp. Asnod6-C07]|uniref:sensor histidine kinase n=1 Tax=Polaribacter sp. Asnod6-C07 TaxID=3160582 RepID=UPI0038673933